jgi:hypothetical protein
VRDYIEPLMAKDAEVTVVLPRHDYPGVLQRLLHDRTSRSLTRALRDEPHVDLVAVPYRLGKTGVAAPGGPAAPEDDAQADGLTPPEPGSGPPGPDRLRPPKQDVRT